MRWRRPQDCQLFRKRQVLFHNLRPFPAKIGRVHGCQVTGLPINSTDPVSVAMISPTETKAHSASLPKSDWLNAVPLPPPLVVPALLTEWETQRKQIRTTLMVCLEIFRRVLHSRR